MLARWPAHPRVSLVTTDGFLFPNAELERRGILHRKGFPESYDRRALLRFVVAVKSGATRSTAPVYSHLIYDVVPDEQVVVQGPDILIIEGLNVLQPARVREDGRTRSDRERLLRLLVYVDAATSDIRQWYVERFLAAARDGVPRPGVVLPPVRRPLPDRGGRAGRRDLGHHQRPEPRAEHPADPRPRRPGAPQGPRPLRPLRAAAQDLNASAYLKRAVYVTGLAGATML